MPLQVIYTNKFIGRGDNINADKSARAFKMVIVEVNKASKVTINLTTGDGWIAIIKKK